MTLVWRMLDGWHVYIRLVARVGSAWSDLILAQSIVAVMTRERLQLARDAWSTRRLAASGRRVLVRGITITCCLLLDAFGDERRRLLLRRRPYRQRASLATTARSDRPHIASPRHSCLHARSSVQAGRACRSSAPSLLIPDVGRAVRVTRGNFLEFAFTVRRGRGGRSGLRRVVFWRRRASVIRILLLLKRPCFQSEPAGTNNIPHRVCGWFVRTPPGAIGSVDRSLSYATTLS